jgi:hypothetical protein
MISHQMTIALTMLIILLSLTAIDTTARVVPSNYITYQNPALGFSINYPNNMTVSENTNTGGPGHTIIFKAKPVVPIIPHLIGILIDVFRGRQASLDDTVRQALGAAVTIAHATVINKTKVIINGLPAYRIESQYPDVHVIGYITINGDTMYNIAFETVDKNPKANFVPIVNTIINSFQYK